MLNSPHQLPTESHGIVLGYWRRRLAFRRYHCPLSHDSALTVLQEVTLIAGKEDDETQFVVHKDFVYHYCPTLKAAFESPCIEVCWWLHFDVNIPGIWHTEQGQTKTYRLEDVEAHTVKLLVHWIYCQDLKVEMPEDAPSSTQYWLIRLCVLADKLLTRRLQNLAMQGIDAARNEHHLVTTSSLHFISDNTASKFLWDSTMSMSVCGT